MNILDKARLLQTSVLSGFLISMGGVAYAQTSDETVTGEEVVEEIVETIDDDYEADTAGGEIVVTGTRLKRDTFSSVSPLQTISTEISQDAGLFDPAAILQKSEAATGQQIDATFNGFVLDNGPGSQTLNLRGLGANRNLLLINGRRVAPSGAEGAPANPSINLIPGSLVDRYDILLDGASSVYGSDAVAGVSNIILRKDFEGLELEVSGDMPEQSGGEDYTLSANYGWNTDRAFVGVGVEYDYRDAVRLGDRDFLAGCETEYEIDENGNIRTGDRFFTDQYAGSGISYPEEPCRVTGLGSRIRRVPGGLGFVYYTPGETNVGIPNFSESALFSVPVDGDGDGVADVNFGNYTPNGEFNDSTFISEQEKVTIMAYGEMTMEGEANITPYFEALYTEAEVFADSGAAQLFTVVPANNPFNPCNPNQPNGVDCGLAADSLLTNPNFEETFRRYYFDGADGYGVEGCFGVPRAFCTPTVFGLLNGPLGPQRAGGGVVVEGDRDQVFVDQSQLRLVGGFKGDLPFLNKGTLNDWTFDAYMSYSESIGESARPGIRDDRLHFALGFDPNIRNATNQLVDLQGGACVPDPGTNVSPDIADGCVPINLFAPSLYDGIIGTFATQAERDYVFDVRDFRTEYAQTIISGFISGNIYKLPAGNVGLVLGAEWRDDNLNSKPDNVARDGLFFGFFSDQGGVGRKQTKEAFAELDIPLLANQEFFRELNVNLAGRITDDEFYGTNETYSIKGGWRPVDSLLLKATYGTSFRAPNLRENFLLGTTGFTNVFDPCVTPDAAVGLDGTYNPALDQRDPVTLANCAADGIDPTNFSPIPGNATVYSAEVSSGGSLTLEPETSTSLTLGFAFEQPFTDWIDAEFNVNYYDINVKDSVIEPSAGFIINDCYIFQANRASTFCSRITRSSLNASANPGSISLVDQGFLNQAEETVRGFDFNMVLGKEIQMFNRLVDWGLDVRANKLEEISDVFIDEVTGEANFDDDVGEFSFPEWTGTARLTADVDNWRFTWTSRFVDAVSQADEFVDEFSDTFGSTAGFTSDTCGGPRLNDVLCRNVGFADSYFTHAASVRYTADTWRLVVGVSNIFDENPPLVDPAEVFSVSNAAIGAGYDYDGRQWFASLRKTF